MAHHSPERDLIRKLLKELDDAEFLRNEERERSLELREQLARVQGEPASECEAALSAEKRQHDITRRDVTTYGSHRSFCREFSRTALSCECGYAQAFERSTLGAGK